MSLTEKAVEFAWGTLKGIAKDKATTAAMGTQAGAKAVAAESTEKDLEHKELMAEYDVKDATKPAEKVSNAAKDASDKTGGGTKE